MSGLSSKKAWRELNQVLGRKGSNGIEAVQTPNGRLTDRHSIADEFNRYFSSWSGISGADNMDTDHNFTMLPVNSRFTFERVEEEILELLGNLDLTKATGLDGISCKMLKMFPPAISCSLTALFSLVWRWVRLLVSGNWQGLCLYLNMAALRKWKIFVR